MAGDDKARADFQKRIADGYATEGKAIGLGTAVLDGAVVTDARAQIPASMCNRHGLIAGATGTGKTKTLQLMAEQLAAIGVPVFAADVKGDLSGFIAPGELNDKVNERVRDVGVAWQP